MDSIIGPGGVAACGWDLVQAISEALSVLGMLELPEDDQPDPSIWHHDERLREWFEALKHRRKNPGTELEPIDEDDPAFTGNALADRYR